jgi:hypothetical protein
MFGNLAKSDLRGAFKRLHPVAQVQALRLR